LKKVQKTNSNSYTLQEYKNFRMITMLALKRV